MTSSLLTLSEQLTLIVGELSPTPIYLLGHLPGRLLQLLLQFVERLHFAVIHRRALGGKGGEDGRAGAPPLQELAEGQGDFGFWHGLDLHRDGEMVVPARLRLRPERRLRVVGGRRKLVVRVAGPVGLPFPLHARRALYSYADGGGADSRVGQGNVRGGGTGELHCRAAGQEGAGGGWRSAGTRVDSQVGDGSRVMAEL